jgi:hypothetical protein
MTTTLADQAVTHQNLGWGRSSGQDPTGMSTLQRVQQLPGPPDRVRTPQPD